LCFVLRERRFELKGYSPAQPPYSNSSYIKIKPWMYQGE